MQGCTAYADCLLSVCIVTCAFRSYVVNWPTVRRRQRCTYTSTTPFWTKCTPTGRRKRKQSTSCRDTVSEAGHTDTEKNAWLWGYCHIWHWNWLLLAAFQQCWNHQPSFSLCACVCVSVFIVLGGRVGDQSSCWDLGGLVTCNGSLYTDTEPDTACSYVSSGLAVRALPLLLLSSFLSSSNISYAHPLTAHNFLTTSLEQCPPPPPPPVVLFYCKLIMNVDKRMVVFDQDPFTIYFHVHGGGGKMYTVLECYN